MALINVSTPGDICGAIIAVANMVGELAKASAAIASDQSPEGRQALANLNAWGNGPAALLNKLNELLKIT